MENIFIDLGESLGVSEGGAVISGDENLLSESDALVGPAGPPGPQGPQGPAGKDGQDGRNATIAIGTTTTGQPGTNASVVNTGTSTNAILNFTIPRGAQGVQGEQGEQGEPGEDGEAATITVGSVTTVSSEYPATVTNSGTTSAAILDFQIPQGIKGETGETGPAGQDGQDGQDGAAATITVGTTTTGSPGTNASVTNSGTSSAAVFNFVIPRGDTGATGPAGQDGQDGQDGAAATISVGTTTTGAAGTNASVTNSGTSSAAVFNFTIPRGDPGVAGQDGADGQDGAAATVTVGTTTTGAAGTNASVTNMGTTSAAILNFTIPRGDTGATGATGATGPQGPQGPTGPAGQGVVNYSSSEVDTGVTWIDGSKVYRKVIPVNGGSNVTHITASLGANVSQIVHIDFYFKFGNNTFYKLWNVKEISCSTSGALDVFFSSNLSSFNSAIFIVDYVK